MIQLIVYTGFYWAVKVMESPLVVNPTTNCTLPWPWISTLWGFRAETAGLGLDCWCLQFMTMVSFPLAEKPCSTLLEISAQLRHATGQAVHTFMEAYMQILFAHALLVVWGGGWSWEEEIFQISFVWFLNLVHRKEHKNHLLCQHNRVYMIYFFFLQT